MVSRPARPAFRRRFVTLTALAALAALATACAKRDDAAILLSEAHIFAHLPSGVGVELPAQWAGRYQVADTITAPAAGLERQLSLRLIRGDSSILGEPLLVVRVFANAGIDSVPPDSVGARWGSVVAKDAVRTLVLRPAPGNPLSADMPDAATFDSLIIALLGRPVKASLRQGNAGR